MKSIFVFLWKLVRPWRWNTFGMTAGAIAIKKLSKTELIQVDVTIPIYHGTRKDAIKALKKIFGKKGHKLVSSYGPIPLTFMSLDQCLEVIGDDQALRHRFEFLILTSDLDTVRKAVEKQGLVFSEYSVRSLEDHVTDNAFELWRRLSVASLTYSEECSECESNWQHSSPDGDCHMCDMMTFPEFELETGLIFIEESLEALGMDYREASKTRTEILKKVLGPSPATIGDLIQAQMVNTKAA